MRMEVSGVFNLRNVADEIGFLARQAQLTLEVGYNQPTADTDSQHKDRDEQADGPFDGVRRPTERQRIEQIDRCFPMRQGLPNLGRDKGPLPIGLEALSRTGNRFGFVVKDSDTDFVAESGFELLHQSLQGRIEPRQSKLSAEDQAPFACGAIPKEDVEFVFDEA